MTDAEVPQITYEELAGIEDEFEEIDTEILRKQYVISQPVYAKRAAAVAKIPNFWPLVLEQSPPEIDQFIQPKDSQIFAESLINIEVTRPEIALGPESISSGTGGNPRSLTIKFEFKPNDDFEDTELTKSFSYRRASDGWTGLVSEPVKINWKAGKDLTEGLTDMAVKLFDARKKKGGFLDKSVPEYGPLKKKVETANGMNTSFFTWFGFVSGRRYVSAEESEKAEKEHAGKSKSKASAETAEDDFEKMQDEYEANDDSEVEVHEAGEELAIALAEDLWPGAIKYFTQAQEDSGDMSDIDFEDMDESDEESEDEAPLDIRSLVQDKGGKSNGRKVSGGPPPSKKQKK